jgi:hypothetical protein
MLRVCTLKLYEICGSVIEVFFFGLLFFVSTYVCYFFFLYGGGANCREWEREKKKKEELNGKKRLKSIERVSNHCISNYISIDQTKI